MALYLTRARIPYETAAIRVSADGRLAFADPYAWHQRAWDCFPGQAEAKRDFLTRIDAKDRHLQFLLLSPSIPTRPDWCPSDEWATKRIDEDAYFSHPKYRFALLANPTRKVRSNEAGELLKNSRRVPVIHREDRESSHGEIQPGLVSWLARQGDAAGFTFDPSSLRTITRPRQTFIRPPKNGDRRHQGTLHAVDFEGILTVADPEKLRAAFSAGIGSAKAFGFGMLCLSPF